MSKGQRASGFILGGLALVLCAPSLAYEAGDVIVRGGVANVAANAVDQTSISATYHANLSVTNNSQIGLTVAYMITPTVGVELLGATPFVHDIRLGGTTLGQTKELPPTLTLQWYPKLSAVAQPYVGVGVNYTRFFDTTHDGLDAALGKNTGIDLSASTGAALEAGVDIPLSSQLMVNLSVWKIAINTDVSVGGTNVGTLKLNPIATLVSLGYRF